MHRTSSRQFWIGCALWSYKDWTGELFPSGSRSRDFLSLYSRRLTTVEGNTTFYATPDAATVQRWASETPPEFQFCLKLPRDITHAGKLEAGIPDATKFLDQTQGLGDRLGPFFAQLPPRYGPDQWQDLITFLQAWPRDRAELALEVRHSDWFCEPWRDRLNDQLKELSMGRVLLDTRPIYQGPDDPQQHSQRRKPKLPLQPVLTAPFTLVRYISHPDLERNQAYLNEWVHQVDQWLHQGTRIYFFVHCPIEARSPGILRHFHNQLEQQGVPVSPLPWNAIAEESTAQLSLF